MAAIAGIGFTVSIFITGLAYDDPTSPTKPPSASSPRQRSPPPPAAPS
jgi:hypothetical protein